MVIQIIPHALERMEERGASKNEVDETVMNGERFPVNLIELGLEKISNSMLQEMETGTPQNK